AGVVLVLVLVLYLREAVARRRLRAGARPEAVATEPETRADELVADASAMVAETEAEAAVATDPAAGRSTAPQKGGLMALAVLYPFAALLVGFTVATFVFLLVALLYLGTRRVPSLMVSAVSAGAIYLFFTELASAPIAGGIWLSLP